MHSELAAEHAQTVGVLECGLGAPRIRIQYVGVVVFFERALDYLAVAAEQVVDLTLRACERKVSHVEFRGYDRRSGATLLLLLLMLLLCLHLSLL